MIQQQGDTESTTHAASEEHVGDDKAKGACNRHTDESLLYRLNFVALCVNSVLPYIS